MGCLSTLSPMFEPLPFTRKGPVWCLHQFFHYLTVTGGSEDIATVTTGLPYRKIEKMVPFSHAKRVTAGLTLISFLFVQRHSVLCYARSVA